MTPQARNARRPALFWRKVKKTGDCWLWTGATDGGGRPQFRFYMKTASAQWYALRLHGIPIKEGTPVSRMCGNRLCVRPEHCAPGKRAMTEASLAARARLPHEERSRHGKLLPEQVIAIRQRTSDGETTKALAKAFGVCPATISHINTGRTWRWVS
jgi:hypothetical protein